MLDKAMSLVRAVEGGPLALTALVHQTGLSRATAHRLAVALEAHGMLRRNTDGRFGMGLQFIEWGRDATGQLDVIAAALVPMHELRELSGESVQLYVRDGEQRRCVAALESPHELRTIVPVGSLLPLDRGSAGRVLLGDIAPAGWVATAADRQAGVGSVSAPVRGADGDIIAAVSVSGPLDRLGGEPGLAWGAAVVDTARRIEAGVPRS